MFAEDVPSLWHKGHNITVECIFHRKQSQQLMVVCQSSEKVPDVGSLISIGIRNRSQQVMVEGKSMEKVPAVSGVPQGSVL